MRLRDLFRGPSNSERKSTPSIQSNIDVNTFLNAALDKDTDTLQKYLLGGFPPDQSDPITKTTALHIAVESGNTRAIQILLQAGAQINSLDSSSSTPLHIAAYLGYDDIIQILLNHGADMYKQDNTGRNAFHVAASTGNHRAIQCFLFEPNIINHPDAQNWTALMCACASNHLSTCLLLLSHGADLCSINDRGQNLFHLAAFLGSNNLIQEIFQLNLDDDILFRALNQIDYRNQTPLFYACIEGHLDFVISLLQAGANPYHLDQENQTCLHAMLSSSVILKRHIYLFYYLVQFIDYRSYQDHLSRTLLDLAFLHQLNTIIYLLILLNYKRNYSILTNQETSENLTRPLLTLRQISIINLKRLMSTQEHPKQFNQYEFIEQLFQQVFRLNLSIQDSNSNEVLHRKSFDDIIITTTTTNKKPSKQTQSTWSLFTNRLKSIRNSSSNSISTGDFHPMKNLALAILFSPIKLANLLDYPSLKNNPLFDEDMKTIMNTYNLEPADFANEI